MATLVDKYFSEADLGAIKDAVGRAEKATSGEIAITLTPHCRHWSTDRWLLASGLSIVAIVAALLLTRDADWGAYYNFTQAALWGIIGFALGYFAISPLLKLPSRRRSVVWKAALKRFSDLRPTRGHTGVLIFVSLEEGGAAIVADKAIAEKLPADYWQQPHAMIEEAMKQGRHAEGIIKAIGEIGSQMTAHFPIQPLDINELPDEPEIIDH